MTKKTKCCNFNFISIGIQIANATTLYLAFSKSKDVSNCTTGGLEDLNASFILLRVMKNDLTVPSGSSSYSIITPSLSMLVAVSHNRIHWGHPPPSKSVRNSNSKTVQNKSVRNTILRVRLGGWGRWGRRPQY